MRQLALLAAICAAAVAVAGAQASAPEQITTPVHESFTAGFLSDICGVPVVISLDGVSHVTLWREGSSGLVVRERDTVSSLRSARPPRSRSPGSKGRSPARDPASPPATSA